VSRLDRPVEQAIAAVVERYGLEPRTGWQLGALLNTLAEDPLAPTTVTDLPVGVRRSFGIAISLVPFKYWPVRLFGLSSWRTLSVRQMSSSGLRGELDSSFSPTGVSSDIGARAYLATSRTLSGPIPISAPISSSVGSRPSS